MLFVKELKRYNECPCINRASWQHPSWNKGIRYVISRPSFITLMNVCLKDVSNVDYTLLQPACINTSLSTAWSCCQNYCYLSCSAWICVIEWVTYDDKPSLCLFCYRHTSQCCHQIDSWAYRKRTSWKLILRIRIHWSGTRFFGMAHQATVRNTLCLVGEKGNTISSKGHLMVKL